MLLSYTLNTHEDDANDARTAIAQIADLFGLSVIIGASSPGDPPGPPPGQLFGPADAVNRDSAAVAAAHAAGLDLARVETDADGLPHDGRIHASSRAKNTDGRWKAKSKVDPAEKARVEAELRAIMGTGPALPPPAASAPPPPAAAPPAPPPPPAAAVPGEPVTFVELMQWLIPYTNSGQLPPEQVSAAMQEIGCVNGQGVGELTALAARVDLVPRAYAALCARIPRV